MAVRAGCYCSTYFYPRPPRGGRLLPRLPEKPYMEISIHALREEGDACFPPRPRKQGEFLSTPSARRATALQ